MRTRKWVGLNAKMSIWVCMLYAAGNHWRILALIVAVFCSSHLTLFTVFSR